MTHTCPVWRCNCHPTAVNHLSVEARPCTHTQAHCAHTHMYTLTLSINYVLTWFMNMQMVQDQRGQRTECLSTPSLVHSLRPLCLPVCVKDMNASNFSCCIFIWLILPPSVLYRTPSCLLQFCSACWCLLLSLSMWAFSVWESELPGAVVITSGQNLLALIPISAAQWAVRLLRDLTSKLPACSKWM